MDKGYNISVKNTQIYMVCEISLCLGMWKKNVWPMSLLIRNPLIVLKS
jgi:hypothetical protein